MSSISHSELSTSEIVLVNANDVEKPKRRGRGPAKVPPTEEVLAARAQRKREGHRLNQRVYYEKCRDELRRLRVLEQVLISTAAV